MSLSKVDHFATGTLQRLHRRIVPLSQVAHPRRDGLINVDSIIDPLRRIRLNEPVVRLHIESFLLNRCKRNVSLKFIRQ